MSTENVKILLRRGFRDEITSTTLEAGEMGFTTDTNQLFVGIDDAINEIQFDPFANAHAIIQSWLDTYELDDNGNNIGDCPYPGLTVDEDLVVRLNEDEDIHTILDAMRFYTQTLTLSNVDSDTFSIGDTLYQYRRNSNNDDIKSIRRGEILSSTIDGNNTKLELKVREQEIFSWRYERSIQTEEFAQQIVDGTIVENLMIYVNREEDAADNDYGLKPGTVDEYHIPTVITVDNGIDAPYNLSVNDDPSSYTFEFIKTDDPINNHFIISFTNPITDLNVSFKVEFDDTDNYWFGTTSKGSINTNVKLIDETGIREFSGAFYGKQRKNVEVVTENSFNQLFADQHLSSLDSVTGLRSSLLLKTLNVVDTTINATDCVQGNQYEIVSSGDTDFTLNGATNSAVGTRFYNTNSIPPIGTGTVKRIGTFLKYNKEVCTTFFIDYSLVQTNDTSTFLRVGQLKVINGVPQGIAQAKLTDDNTEIWQDGSDSIAEVDEFSNIEFSASINGDNLEINFTQNENFTTEVSYTVKRWSM